MPRWASLAVKRAGTYIAVVDGSGQQLVTSRVPYGAPLPKPPVPEHELRALAAGGPYVPDVAMGTLSHRWVYGLTIPLKVERLPSRLLKNS